MVEECISSVGHESDENTNNGPHVISEILEVKLSSSIDWPNFFTSSQINSYQNGNQNLVQGTLFMVEWACPCCRDGRKK